MTGDSELTEWRVRVDDTQFFTRLHTTDEDASWGEDVEPLALEKLIEGLQSGEVEVDWEKRPMTMDDLHNEAEQVRAQTCDECQSYTRRERREVVVGDDISFVCPTCVNRFKNVCNSCNRHRDELDPDESMKVTGRTVVEYLCSTCYTNEAETEVV